MSSISELIKIYNESHSCPVEIEIRYKNITKNMFDKTLEYLSTNSQYIKKPIESTVNIIDPSTSRVCKIIFENGKAKSQSYYEKKMLAKPLLFKSQLNYSININSECDIPKFSPPLSSIVRFKHRISFEFNKWRYDLTAVKQSKFSDVSQNIKTLAQKLFSDNVQLLLFENYEIEIEFIGQSLMESDFNVIYSIFGDGQYHKVIYDIAKLLLPFHKAEIFKQRGLKQLLNKAIALDKNTYYRDVFPPIGMFITDKADGIRAIIYINDNVGYILRSDSLKEINVGNCPNLLVDAEEINGEFYIFDVMVFEKNISHMTFNDRLKYFENVTLALNTSGIKAHSKKFIKVSDLQQASLDILQITNNNNYNWDGIILTSPNEDYNNTKNYKWKSYENNTIDFLAIKCPPTMLNLSPYNIIEGKTLYLLFVGINHQMRDKLGLGFISFYKTIFPNTNGKYYPIQFSPSINPLAYLFYSDNSDLHNQIVELTMDRKYEEWKLVKIRTDRKLENNYYGNDYKIAELTYLNYVNPFDFEELWTLPNIYFTKVADNIYTEPNRYKRYVISIMISKYLKSAKWIIDLGSGRGADLHRYIESKIENALFIDIDASAIAELISRKLNYKKKGGRDNDDSIRPDIIKDTNNFTAHTLIMDLKTKYTQIIASTYKYGVNKEQVDGIVSNFTFHYMCDSVTNIRNILLFVANMLKINGVFLITVMNGKSIFELLSTVDNEWFVMENNVKKYAIKKCYNGNTLAEAGQNISVLLPFSDKMYEEPLCNVDAVIDIAKSIGFEVIFNESMGIYVEDIKSSRVTFGKKLTPDDIHYINLHQYIIFKLTKRLAK